MKCPSCSWDYMEAASFATATDRTCKHCNSPIPKPSPPKVSLEKVVSKSNDATVSKKSQAKFLSKTQTAVDGKICDMSIDLEGWNLHRAAQENKVDISRALIDRGDNIETKRGGMPPPLHVAASWNSLDVVRLLIESGANIDALDEGDRTPLYWALLNEDDENFESARLLIKHGADVDAWNDHSGTILQEFVEDIVMIGPHFSSNGARLLIEHGADTEGIDLSWMNQLDREKDHWVKRGGNNTAQSTRRTQPIKQARRELTSDVAKVRESSNIGSNIVNTQLKDEEAARENWASKEKAVTNAFGAIIFWSIAAIIVIAIVSAIVQSVSTSWNSERIPGGSAGHDGFVDPR